MALAWDCHSSHILSFPPRLESFHWETCTHAEVQIIPQDISEREENKISEALSSRCYLFKGNIVKSFNHSSGRNSSLYNFAPKALWFPWN